MLTEEQKARIIQRFTLFTEHMKNSDDDGKGTEDIINTAKLLTLQMTDDEKWICVQLESAYTQGNINAILGLFYHL